MSTILLTFERVTPAQARGYAALQRRRAEELRELAADTHARADNLTALADEAMREARVWANAAEGVFTGL